MGSLLAEYRDARRDEDVARLRRVFALRAMVATGLSQRVIAEQLGISQPAVSQQLKFAPDLAHVHPEDLLEAAAPVLTALADERGYGKLAVFGSVARKRSRIDSDLDLLVEPPKGSSSFDFVEFKMLLERVLGREIDLVSWVGSSLGWTPTCGARRCCCDESQGCQGASYAVHSSEPTSIA